MAQPRRRCRPDRIRRSCFCARGLAAELAASRIDLHRHPYYYALRKHIVDFLVSRGTTFASDVTDHDPRSVPVVRPGLSEPTIVSPPRMIDTNPAQTIAR